VFRGIHRFIASHWIYFYHFFVNFFLKKKRSKISTKIQYVKKEKSKLKKLNKQIYSLLIDKSEYVVISIILPTIFCKNDPIRKKTRNFPPGGESQGEG
jgi:hypothetical protein